MVQVDLKKESDFKERYCEECGEALFLHIELLGKERTVPRLCKCSKEKLEKEEKEILAREKQIRLEQVINNSLMDSKFYSCTFKNWDRDIVQNEKLYKLTSNYARNFAEAKSRGIGLTIYGAVGNGKTYATSCIANYLLNKSVPIICVSINSLLDKIKQSYGKFGQAGEDAILKSLANADLLIIDDLGTEQNTEWSIPKIYNIIDSRYRDNKPLIITTNLTMDDLKKRYGERTHDRMKEKSTPYKHEGESLRVNNARENTNFIKKLLEG